MLLCYASWEAHRLCVIGSFLGHLLLIVMSYGAADLHVDTILQWMAFQAGGHEGLFGNSGYADLRHMGRQQQERERDPLGYLG